MYIPENGVPMFWVIVSVDVKADDRRRCHSIAANSEDSSFAHRL